MHTKRRSNNMNGGGGNGGGQHRHHNNNRPRRFNNNNSRQDGGNDSASVTRTRRHATQQKEKYQNMARDAMSMGDRVLAENYLQHADHFHRVILSLPPEEVRHQNQPRNQGDEANTGNVEAQHRDNGDTGADMNEPASMPSAGALPSFITQQPMGGQPQQNYEE